MRALEYVRASRRGLIDASFQIAWGSRLQRTAAGHTQSSRGEGVTVHRLLLRTWPQRARFGSKCSPGSSCQFLSTVSSANAAHHMCVLRMSVGCCWIPHLARPVRARVRAPSNSCPRSPRVLDQSQFASPRKRPSAVHGCADSSTHCQRSIRRSLANLPICGVECTERRWPRARAIAGTTAKLEAI